MKKVTLKKDEEVSEFIVFDNIEAKENIVTLRCIDGSLVSFSLLEDRQIIIEDYKEPRDWVLVVGIASKAIYSVNESQFSPIRHVKLQDFLTEKEANELVKSLNQEIDSYKF